MIRAQGGKGLDDYEPPSESLAAWLERGAVAEGEEPLRGPDRAAQVAALAAAVGGEAG